MAKYHLKFAASDRRTPQILTLTGDEFLSSQSVVGNQVFTRKKAKDGGDFHSGIVFEIANVQLMRSWKSQGFRLLHALGPPFEAGDRVSIFFDHDEDSVLEEIQTAGGTSIHDLKCSCAVAGKEGMLKDKYEFKLHVPEFLVNEKPIKLENHSDLMRLNNVEPNQENMGKSNAVMKMDVNKRIGIIIMLVGAIGGAITLALMLNGFFTMNTLPMVTTLLIFLICPLTGLFAFYHELEYREKGIWLIILGGYFTTIISVLFFHFALAFFIKAGAILTISWCCMFIFPGLFMIARKDRIHKAFGYVDSQGAILAFITALFYGLLNVPLVLAFGIGFLISFILIGVVALKFE